ncbi:hypothetical protein PHMEG_00036959 [Phytophthora megakarya]|uniref:Uncharacterized protein n=1 Tax=Phytophthora megakarya TaxID=4795 RepID=A0A225UN78_9STRA|nr:hypothetical protein PHMEG_00036959 [Phytophthora megakarya]
MDKSRVHRQPSRGPGRSASSQSLGNSGSHPHLNEARPPTQHAEDDAVHATPAAFDALELLGPSLAEVLTFVHPPQPRRLQDAQDAGDPTNGEANDDNQRSTNSLTDKSAKFDLRLSRSALLGKLSDPSVDNARKTQEYFSKVLSKMQCEATGLVLLHDATIVVFLETTAEQFVAILKQLHLQRIIDPNSMKILANSDDHGVRILQGLYFKKIVHNRSDAEWTEDAAPQCIVETFLNLIKFVRKIGPMPPNEIRKCLTNLSNTDQTFLPSNDLVLWLLNREELMTLDEYIEFFDKPIVVELESERVWPLHPLLHY